MQALRDKHEEGKILVASMSKSSDLFFCHFVLVHLIRFVSFDPEPRQTSKYISTSHFDASTLIII